MLDGAGAGLAYVFSIGSILLLLGATTLGSIVAILPGISAPIAMALLLPLSLGMSTNDAMMMMTALMAASGFTGSMTSILLNIPGDGINAATCLDGYPMARQGKAGVAIGASATASGLGALFGLGVLILSLPIIKEAILVFGPPEFFALVLAALSVIAAISPRAPLKGLISGVFGLVLAFIGMNATAGGVRFTFGIIELSDGISLTAAVIGLFAIPELFDLLRSEQSISRVPPMKGDVWEGVLAVLRRPALLIRSSVIGTVVGAIPGIGGGVASWFSYYVAMNRSKDPGSFGRGNIEGVIAPEAAVDAKEGGSMMPVLALGIPGSVSTAILLVAFQLHGVVAGRPLFQNDAPLIWIMILAMVFSNVSTSVLGLMFAGSMVKITRVPAAIIAPIVLILGVVGAYADAQAMFGALLMLVVGFIGLVMERHGYPRAPLLIGLILLPLAETNWHLSVQISRGSYEFLLRPLTLLIFAVTVLALAIPQWRAAVARRKRHGSAAARAETAVEQGLAEALGTVEDAARAPSWVALAIPIVALALSLTMLLQTFGLTYRESVFPRIVLVPFIGLLLLRLWKDAPPWWRGRRGGIAAPPRAQDAAPAHSDRYVSAWIAGLFVVTSIVGMLVASGAYLAAFMLFFSRRAITFGRALRAGVGGVVMAAFVYYAFPVFLGLQLYDGLVGALLSELR